MLTLVSFLGATFAVALISWWHTRRIDNTDARTYYLADRKLPWIQVAGALLLTNLSTEQLIGLNGAAALHGASVMAWEVVPIFALIAMAAFFLPRYWAGNITTVPEFLEQRFDAATRRLMGAVFLGTLAFNILPFVLYSGGVAMSSIFHLPERLGISPAAATTLMAVAITVIGWGYVVLGGMKAVALSDTLYGAGLLAAGLLIPVLGLRALGDGDLAAGWTRVLAHQAVKLDPVGGPTANVPFSTLFTGMLFINLFYWCANQLIVQRSFGAASFAEAQKGILATAALKLLGPLYLVFPGIIAAEMFGAAGVGNGDLAYARLVDAVLPGWMAGLFAAVLLGSIISSFNGGLHSAATLFSLDLYGSWLRPAASEGEKLRAGKFFAAAVCLVSLACSEWLGDAPEGVFTLMKRIMAAFKLPLLAVVVVAMLSHRVPSWAAKTALLGGVGLFFLMDTLVGQGRFGVKIHWLHLGAINTVLLIAFMAAAAHWSPAKAREKIAAAQRSAGSVAQPPAPVPWGGLRIASVSVAVAAIGLYFGLWCLANRGAP